MQKLLGFLVGIFMMTNVVAGGLYEKLDQRMQQSDSLVCVGLDPDLQKMPLELNAEENITPFLKEIVDITVPHACAFKIQKAFFENF